MPHITSLSKRRHLQFAQTEHELFIPEKKYLIAPSLLSANMATLGEEANNVLKAGANVLHFDVMDNHFVPNLTMGPMICSSLRNYGISAPIDVHLMVSPVEQMIRDFAAAGATSITFHPEATDHVHRNLELIRSLGCRAGLVFNPATTLDICKHVMDTLDIILLMSVNPGFGGQQFISSVLDKARNARTLIDQSKCGIRLEIDGGVSEHNIKEIAEAGVDMFVAGSAVFKDPRTVESYATTIHGMQRELSLA